MWTNLHLKFRATKNKLKTMVILSVRLIRRRKPSFSPQVPLSWERPEDKECCFFLLQHCTTEQKKKRPLTLIENIMESFLSIPLQAVHTSIKEQNFFSQLNLSDWNIKDQPVTFHYLNKWGARQEGRTQLHHVNGYWHPLMCWCLADDLPLWSCAARNADRCWQAVWNHVHRDMCVYQIQPLRRKNGLLKTKNIHRKRSNFFFGSLSAERRDGCWRNRAIQSLLAVFIFSNKLFWSEEWQFEGGLSIK